MKTTLVTFQIWETYFRKILALENFVRGPSEKLIPSYNKMD